jgi:spermidine synthase
MRSRPFILETASERHLLFAHDSVQSTMRLDDPDALTCDYTRKMMAFLLFNPDPRDILMIGLGGGSIPKFCYRHLPDARITVVEIDADVIALRDEFCVPLDNSRFRVVHDDGVRYISQLEDLMDVIIIDAFDAAGIAPSLGATAFYEQTASRLKPDGVLVMNLSGEPHRYDSHLKRMHDAFGDHTILVPVKSGDNELLFAFKGPVQLASAELEVRAEQLQAKLSLEFPRFLRRICSRRDGLRT